MIFAIRFVLKNFEKSKIRSYGIAAIIIAGIVIIRITSEPGIEAIEAVNPATAGFLGGLGLPIVFSWIVGGFFAAGLAFVVGKVALRFACRLFSNCYIAYLRNCYCCY